MTNIERNTKETRIKLSLEHPLGTERGSRILLECGFMAHMIELLAHRGRFMIDMEASGDLFVDAHHLTEDIGITLGRALRTLIAESDIQRRRYGQCLLPMDGSLALIAIDLSGRGALYWQGEFPTERCGEFDMELVPEFFRGFCREAGVTMHVRLLSADNSHHAAEAIFKGVGMALDMALGRSDVDPSTKGEWM